jgi:hypothetical protein
MSGVLNALQGAEAGGAQSIKFVNVQGGQNIQGSTTFTQPNGVTIAGALAAADAATLVNGTGGAPTTGGMAQDVYNQIIAAATLARLQAFVAGQG